MYLNEQNIKCVPNSENPPNTPEIRCIENFWGFIKREVYKLGWEAENWINYELGYLIVFKKVDQKCVQNSGESRGVTLSLFVKTKKTFFRKQ